MDFCTPQETPVVVPSVEARTVMLLSSVASADPTPAQNFIAPEGYIQHNLGLPDGLEPFVGMVTTLGADPTTSANIHRVFASGNFVVAHSTFNLPILGSEITVFDVYRYDENGIFLEHWDNVQPVFEPNPSGRTAVDGPIIPTDLDKTQENCEHVVNFVNTVLVGGLEGVDLSDYINPEMYIQHNPNMADGIEGFTTAMSDLADANQIMRYDEIHLVVAQGSFVFVASEGAMGAADNPTPTAFFELFRVENGLIVEHWDVISPIPPREEWQNDNGKF